MAVIREEWDGRWHRSLDAIALAAERAADAGDFDPLGSEFVMEWPNQERRYSWYDAAAVDDTRRYGFPARAVLTVYDDDRVRGELTIIADSGIQAEEPPRVRVLARGIADEKVKPAFEAARATLADESLARIASSDRRLIRADDAAQRSKPSLVRRAIRRRAKRMISVIEAHPASVTAAVSVFGVVVAAVVAIALA